MFEIFKKTTAYFQHIKQRSDRAKIKQEWVEKAIYNPTKTEKQKDGRIRKWTIIENESKHLRVILLEDGEAVHNAFFDRDFKKNK